MVIVSILVVAPLFAFSQEYNTAIGIRGGFAQGLTIKHFIGQQKALEGILATRWGGYSIIGLYEINKPINDADGLSWFYGLGGHIGFWDSADNRGWWPNDTGQKTVIGFDLIIGLEYTIPNAPINFQLDYKPAFHFVGYQGTGWDGGAFSVRFTL